MTTEIVKPSASGHYFDAEPEVPSKPKSVWLRLPDLEIELESDRGVFGSMRIDLGTLVFLKEMEAPPQAGELLDLGCGYGPIAVTLARRARNAHIWAIDVNQRALDLGRANAKKAKVGNISFGTPDEVPPGVRFDAIYSNPPVRVGKAELHNLLVRWLDRLKPAGRAFLVMQRTLGADSLMAWLSTQGYTVKRTRSKKGYRLFTVSPKPTL